LKDEVLAARAGRGDPAALSLLLSRWRGPLVRFCRRITRHEEDARDVAQDALLRATRAMETYDTGRPFAPWMYRIARNTCLNHLERERRRSGSAPATDLAAETPTPDVLVARREEVARIRAALAGLGARDRELLRMKLVEGLGNEAIARRLGISSGALRTRASRALGRLREALEAGGGTP
jgi:RNA polymerase sigma-70 factor (ECF subfamily)